MDYNYWYDTMYDRLKKPAPDVKYKINYNKVFKYFYKSYGETDYVRAYKITEALKQYLDANKDIPGTFLSSIYVRERLTDDDGFLKYINFRIYGIYITPELCDEYRLIKRWEKC